MRGALHLGCLESREQNDLSCVMCLRAFVHSFSLSSKHFPGTYHLLSWGATQIKRVSIFKFSKRTRTETSYIISSEHGGHRENDQEGTRDE